MTCFATPLTHTPRRRPQRGVALFAVMVFVLLSMLLALWASRTALFSELVLGNDADYQRAWEAATALVQDAEYDIRNQQADGSVCSAAACRSRQSGLLQIPLVEGDFVSAARHTLYTAPRQCQDALCLKRTGNQDWWNDAGELAAMQPLGAHYGQYTGAVRGAHGNPLLEGTGSKQKGWYWIEMMEYGKPQDLTNAPKGFLELDLKPSVVFRITALAQGRKPNTVVVLQQTYARPRLMD